MGYECSAFAIYNEPHFKPKENIQVGLQPVEISIHKVGNHFSVLESEKKQTDEKLLPMQAPFFNSHSNDSRQKSCFAHLRVFKKMTKSVAACEVWFSRLNLMNAN